MKKLILSIILASVALTSVNAAAPCKREEHNLYLQTTGSYGWHNKSKVKVGKYTGSEKQKNGFGGAVAIGYIIDCWRLEIEGSHRHNGSKYEIGLKSNTSLMGNIYFDMPVTDLISFYLGAGAGVSSVNAKAIKYEVKDSKLVKFKKKHGHFDTVFAWQAMGGISYAISDNVDLVTGYRLFSTSRPTVARFNGRKAKLSNIPLIHSIDLGLRFKF